MRHFASLAIVAFLATLIPAINPAAASGAVWCNADDAALTFAMRSGVSHGISGGFLNFTADLAIKLAGVPADFQSLHFGEAAVSQHWLDGKEFQLELARERATGPSGYVLLDVLTQLVSEGHYRGHYELRVFAQSANDLKGKDWASGGPIACSTE